MEQHQDPPIPSGPEYVFATNFLFNSGKRLHIYDFKTIPHQDLVLKMKRVEYKDINSGDFRTVDTPIESKYSNEFIPLDKYKLCLSSFSKKRTNDWNTIAFNLHQQIHQTLHTTNKIQFDQVCAQLHVLDIPTKHDNILQADLGRQYAHMLQNVADIQYLQAFIQAMGSPDMIKAHLQPQVYQSGELNNILLNLNWAYEQFNQQFLLKKYEKVSEQALLDRTQNNQDSQRIFEYEMAIQAGSLNNITTATDILDENWDIYNMEGYDGDIKSSLYFLKFFPWIQKPFRTLTNSIVDNDRASAQEIFASLADDYPVFCLGDQIKPSNEIVQIYPRLHDYLTVDNLKELNTLYEQIQQENLSSSTYDKMQQVQDNKKYLAYMQAIRDIHQATADYSSFQNTTYDQNTYWGWQPSDIIKLFDYNSILVDSFDNLTITLYQQLCNAQKWLTNIKYIVSLQSRIHQMLGPGTIDNQLYKNLANYVKTNQILDKPNWENYNDIFILENASLQSIFSSFRSFETRAYDEQYIIIARNLRPNKNHVEQKATNNLFNLIKMYVGMSYATHSNFQSQNLIMHITDDIREWEKQANRFGYAVGLLSSQKKVDQTAASLVNAQIIVAQQDKISLQKQNKFKQEAILKITGRKGIQSAKKVTKQEKQKFIISNLAFKSNIQAAEIIIPEQIDANKNLSSNQTAYNIQNQLQDFQTSDVPSILKQIQPTNNQGTFFDNVINCPLYLNDTSYNPQDQSQFQHVIVNVLSQELNSQNPAGAGFTGTMTNNNLTNFETLQQPLQQPQQQISQDYLPLNNTQQVIGQQQQQQQQQIFQSFQPSLLQPQQQPQQLNNNNVQRNNQANIQLQNELEIVQANIERQKLLLTKKKKDEVLQKFIIKGQRADQQKLIKEQQEQAQQAKARELVSEKITQRAIQDQLTKEKQEEKLLKQQLSRQQQQQQQQLQQQQARADQLQHQQQTRGNLPQPQQGLSQQVGQQQPAANPVVNQQNVQPGSQPVIQPVIQPAQQVSQSSLQIQLDIALATILEQKALLQVKQEQENSKIENLRKEFEIKFKKIETQVLQQPKRFETKQNIFQQPLQQTYAVHPNRNNNNTNQQRNPNYKGNNYDPNYQKQFAKPPQQAQPPQNQWRQNQNTYSKPNLLPTYDNNRRYNQSYNQNQNWRQKKQQNYYNQQHNSKKINKPNGNSNRQPQNRNLFQKKQQQQPRYNQQINKMNQKFSKIFGNNFRNKFTQYGNQRKTQNKSQQYNSNKNSNYKKPFQRQQQQYKNNNNYQGKGNGRGNNNNNNNNNNRNNNKNNNIKKYQSPFKRSNYRSNNKMKKTNRYNFRQNNTQQRGKKTFNKAIKHVRIPLCKLNHPWNTCRHKHFKQAICKFRNTCALVNTCSFYHPTNNHAMCKLAKFCANPDCQFVHPKSFSNAENYWCWHIKWQSHTKTSLDQLVINDILHHIQHVLLADTAHLYDLSIKNNHTIEIKTNDPAAAVQVQQASTQGVINQYRVEIKEIVDYNLFKKDNINKFDDTYKIKRIIKKEYLSHQDYNVNTIQATINSILIHNNIRFNQLSAIKEGQIVLRTCTMASIVKHHKINIMQVGVEALFNNKRQVLYANGQHNAELVKQIILAQQAHTQVNLERQRLNQVKQQISSKIHIPSYNRQQGKPDNYEELSIVQAQIYSVWDQYVSQTVQQKLVKHCKEIYCTGLASFFNTKDFVKDPQKCFQQVISKDASDEMNFINANDVVTFFDLKQDDVPQMVYRIMQEDGLRQYKLLTIACLAIKQLQPVLYGLLNQDEADYEDEVPELIEEQHHNVNESFDIDLI